MNLFSAFIPHIGVSANKDAHTHAAKFILCFILPGGHHRLSRKPLPSDPGPGGAGMNNVATAPTPPSLHWAVVLVLDLLTLGLFGYFWMFRQAQFARKIDPSNRAVFQVLVSVMLFLFSFLMAVIVGWTVARGGQSTDLSGVMNIMRLFQILMVITAYTQIRKSLNMRYGLQLNPILAVIFNVFYVQYHLSKLAKDQQFSIPGAMLPTSRAGSASV